MKSTTTIVFITFLLLLTSCVGELARKKTPEELRVELKQQELANPMQYLESKTVILQPKKKKIRNAGIFRSAKYIDDGALITGLIVNTATLAKYKDVIIKVSFYSQTKTRIEEKSYVLYEYYKPNSEQRFSIKVNPPKDYKNFHLQIVNGIAVH